MKTRILFIAMLLLGVTACYEDKGNYEYMVMNDIEISVETDSHTYVLGEKVVCIPKLTFALGKENSELSYEWTFDDHVIAHTRDLDWTADIMGSDKDLRLAIRDEKTGVTYYKIKGISVTSPYGTNGWLVLSEKDGNSTLAFLRERTEGGKLKPIVTRDIYQMINGEPMGSQPVSMYPHWTEPWEGEDDTSWLWVAQKGGRGAIDLSGTSYRQEGVLSQMFVDKTYPEGFTPAKVIDMQFLTMAVGEDGTIYTRVKESNLLFNSSAFVDRPLTSDKDGKMKVDGSMIGYSRFDTHGGILLYDKNSGQYLHIGDYGKDNGEVFTGKVLPLDVDEKTYTNNPSYARLDNMKDYTVHYLGSHSTSGNEYTAIIEKKNSGDFYIQKFKVKHYSGDSSSKLGATYISQEKNAELGTIIDGTSKNCFALCRYQDLAPYLFISKGNMLYLYYTTTGQLYPCAQFDSPVTSIDPDNYNNKYIMVGLENGDVIILKGEDDGSDDTLKRYVINQGKTIRVTDEPHKLVLFHEKGFGRIVQVCYKWRASWNEDFYSE